MQENLDELLLSAIERYKNNAATQDDLKIIGKALASGQIEIVPSTESKNIKQSGGTNFGESNEIRVTGSVIGTQSISGFTADEVLELLEHKEKEEVDYTKILTIVGVIGIIAIAMIGIFLLVKDQIPGTATQTTFEIITSTLSPSITTSQSELAIKTSTLTPTNSPKPTPVTSTPTPTGSLYFADSCINTNNWEYVLSVSASQPSIDNNGCIDLGERGFAAKENELIIDVITTESNEEFGIYTPVNGATRISFKFQINEFKTGGTVSDISFGVVPINNGESPSGKALIYKVVSTAPVLQVESSESNDYEVYDLENHPNQLIEFLINEFDQLTININGNEFQEKTKIDFEDKAFIIMYNLPREGSRLSAKLSEFDIEKP